MLSQVNHLVRQGEPRCAQTHTGRLEFTAATKSPAWLPPPGSLISSPDTECFLCRMALIYVWSMRWMRKRGDRVTITTGKYAGQTGTVESNVYQMTVDYPDERSNGYHIMLDIEKLVTVRWDQVESSR